MNKPTFSPPSPGLYKLQRLAQQMSLLSPDGQRAKAREFFEQARRFLERGEACNTIGGGRQ